MAVDGTFKTGKPGFVAQTGGEGAFTEVHYDESFAETSSKVISIKSLKGSIHRRFPFSLNHWLMLIYRVELNKKSHYSLQTS